MGSSKERRGKVNCGPSSNEEKLKSIREACDDIVKQMLDHVYDFEIEEKVNQIRSITHYIY